MCFVSLGKTSETFLPESNSISRHTCSRACARRSLRSDIAINSITKTVCVRTNQRSYTLHVDDPIERKNEAFEGFKKFKKLVEQETGNAIKTFRTDRGGEFCSKEFQTLCDNHGIKRHLTAPYSPQQNGVVERRNRTLMEMTRSIMKHMKVPNYLWGEAVRHSTYLINRVSTRTLKEQTPYECLKKKKPSVQHLRVFWMCMLRKE